MSENRKMFIKIMNYLFLSRSLALLRGTKSLLEPIALGSRNSSSNESRNGKKKKQKKHRDSAAKVPGCRATQAPSNAAPSRI